MRRGGLLLAIALVLATNAFILVGVARNRAGEPEAEIELTERELGFGPRYNRFADENSGLFLILHWSVALDDSWSGHTPEWFDADKLASLGFDCGHPVTSQDAWAWYSRALPREAYAVLEYEGEIWQRWLSSQEKQIAELAAKVERGEAETGSLKSARTHLQGRKLMQSRLFVVDVGLDPRALRQRYPDKSRHIITPAMTRLDLYSRQAGSPPVLRGRVSEVLIDEMHVPKHMRRELEQILDEADQRVSQAYGNSTPWERVARYAVTVKYGRRHEPWIDGLRKLSPEEAAGP